MRIGQGYDAHRFQDGDHIVIGGVKIPFEQGLAAHSDGDVLLHAIKLRISSIYGAIFGRSAIIVASTLTSE